MLPLYLVIFITGYIASILLTRSIEAEDLDMLEAVGKRAGIDTKKVQRILQRFRVHTG